MSEAVMEQAAEDVPVVYNNDNKRPKVQGEKVLTIHDSSPLAVIRRSTAANLRNTTPQRKRKITIVWGIRFYFRIR